MNGVYTMKQLIEIWLGFSVIGCMIVASSGKLKLPDFVFVCGSVASVLIGQFKLHNARVGVVIAAILFVVCAIWSASRVRTNKKGKKKLNKALFMIAAVILAFGLLIVRG